MIHVDTREPRDMWALTHSALCPLPHEGPKFADCQLISVHKLDSADYCMYDKDGHSLGLERKAGADLLGSLQHKQANNNKRLYDQLERMGLEYTHRALILESSYGYDPFTKNATIGLGPTGWFWSSLEMMMWGFESDGIKIFRTPSKPATVELLRILHQRAEKGCVLPHGWRTPLALVA